MNAAKMEDRLGKALRKVRRAYSSIDSSRKSNLEEVLIDLKGAEPLLKTIPRNISEQMSALIEVACTMLHGGVREVVQLMARGFAKDNSRYRRAVSDLKKNLEEIMIAITDARMILRPLLG